MKLFKPVRLFRQTLIGLTIMLPFVATNSQASPIVGPDDMSFYSPPSISDGNHGDLIWYRETDVQLGEGAPETKAWNLLYHSNDALGQPNFVTGTMLIPNSNWNGTGDRPVISYAVGTHGMAQQCAPSIQMSRGSDYENINISTALNAGYAVLVTDNPGYTNNAVLPSYMVGKAQAYAAMDIIKAASQVPGGIAQNAKTAIWGYSQGGQTAAWAGELHNKYAPDINLTAVASGGTPADFLDTAFYLDGSTGASFMLSAIIGLSQQYPNDLPIGDYVNFEGEAAIDTASNQCVFESLFNLMNDDLAKYTLGNKDLSTMLEELPSAKQVVKEQALGNERIDVPLYLYHGQADEFIRLEQNYKLKKKYCELGTRVKFDLYPSEHIVTQFQAAPQVLDWLEDRFKGKKAPSTCRTWKRDPVSNANPGGGNFVISMKEWPLDAELKLKTLNQTVELPKKSTFTTDTDMTAQTLNGTLDVPTFFTRLQILLPLKVKLSVTGSQPTVGKATLDKEGILNVTGTSYADIKIRSAGISFFQIPFGCQTRDQVEFPLDFEGPVSSLGSGALNFTGSTSFPPMRNCGLFNGLFTTLMSGSGQLYSFNVSPPKPVAN